MRILLAAGGGDHFLSPPPDWTAALEAAALSSVWRSGVGVCSRDADRSEFEGPDPRLPGWRKSAGGNVRSNRDRCNHRALSLRREQSSRASPKPGTIHAGFLAYALPNFSEHAFEVTAQDLLDVCIRVAAPDQAFGEIKRSLGMVQAGNVVLGPEPVL